MMMMMCINECNSQDIKVDDGPATEALEHLKRTSKRRRITADKADESASSTFDMDKFFNDLSSPSNAPQDSFPEISWSYSDEEDELLPRGLKQASYYESLLRVKRPRGQVQHGLVRSKAFPTNLSALGTSGNSDKLASLIISQVKPLAHTSTLLNEHLHQAAYKTGSPFLTSRSHHTGELAHYTFHDR